MNTKYQENIMSIFKSSLKFIILYLKWKSSLQSKQMPCLHFELWNL